MTPLSVYIHPYIFFHGRFGGIARYVCEVAAHLEQYGVELHLPISDTANEYLKKAPFFPRTSAEVQANPLWVKAFQKLIQWKYPDKARHFGFMRQAIGALKAGRYDLIHPSYTNAADLLPHIGKTPMVVTIHDMTHERFPASFLPCDPTARRKKLYVERATRIIAISENTKKDLIDILHVDPGKIDVIHHGNSLLLPPEPWEGRLNVPEPYFLFVGKRGGYKNFDLFAKAFADVAASHPDLHLICAGGGDFSRQERELIRQLHIENKVCYRALSDEELALCYQRSIAFVYPSLYEGFGLPILEAFACGSPVLCSNASCFPEIAGAAALYFEGHDRDSMSHAMHSILQSESSRQSLISRGALRLKSFSWDKCAKETRQCYDRAVG